MSILDFAINLLGKCFGVKFQVFLLHLSGLDSWNALSIMPSLEITLFAVYRPWEENYTRSVSELLFLVNLRSSSSYHLQIISISGVDKSVYVCPYVHFTIKNSTHVHTLKIIWTSTYKRKIQFQYAKSAHSQHYFKLYIPENFIIKIKAR